MKTIAINEIELKNIISEVVSCINEKKKKEKDFWEKRNWHDIKKGTPDRYDAKRGAPAFQSDDVGDEAWKNN